MINTQKNALKNEKIEICFILIEVYFIISISFTGIFSKMF